MSCSFNQNRLDDVPASYWQASAAAHTRGWDRLPARADVLVIGGGLLGAAAAYWLAELIALVGVITVAIGLLFYRHARGLWTSILYLTGSIFED